MPFVIHFRQHIGKSGVKIGRLVGIVTALAQVGRWRAANIADFGTPRVLFARPVAHFALHIGQTFDIFANSEPRGISKSRGVTGYAVGLIVFLFLQQAIKCPRVMRVFPVCNLGSMASGTRFYAHICLRQWIPRAIRG